MQPDLRRAGIPGAAEFALSSALGGLQSRLNGFVVPFTPFVDLFQQFALSAQKSEG